ncbi:Adh6p [Sugiyamaella lignohabitans]|uniref:alcohol dehydrogenase (NADP(+)) n=1 Tax=Sugiyamaella lignohabitans TaxID=796027 RepID=A0A167CUK7_9ASCO|nr:Adh6p [Sugiyamaella lignohabitans]ANB12122.1 Adh6p [Sugiyamaella lignohabitans]
MVYPDTFRGYAHTKEGTKNVVPVLKEIEFKPKVFAEHDVDIKVVACGVCGSDVHSVCGEWGSTDYPLIPGHEIVGHVVRVGSKVTTVKVGDRVGVGAQSFSCLECPDCLADNEPYCLNSVGTYGGKYENGDKSYGGYSDYARVHEHFVFTIPDNLSFEGAAPLLCAGITTYSPLVRHGAGPGKTVGIVGIGGLGHFGLMWAKALGAEVYALSRSESKKADAIKLGADHYVATGVDGWHKTVERKFDFILCCANSADNFDLNSYLKTLKVGGHFINVGLPEDNYTVHPTSFLKNASFLGSSLLGSRKEIQDMLKLASEQKLEAWHSTIPVNEEGVYKALDGCKRGTPKYRYVLTNYEQGFTL